MRCRSHAPKAPFGPPQLPWHSARPAAPSEACSTQSTWHPDGYAFTLTRLLQFPRQSSAYKQAVGLRKNRMKMNRFSSHCKVLLALGKLHGEDENISRRLSLKNRVGKFKSEHKHLGTVHLQQTSSLTG